MPEKKDNAQNEIDAGLRKKTSGRLKKEKKAVDAEILAISRLFKYSKLITALLAVIFLLSMLSFRRKDITVENFQYLMRFMEISSTTYNKNQNYRKIVYSTDTEITFSGFRGDFVVANSSALNIYNLSGNNILSEFNYINNPVIKSSEKYLLVYDLGGYNYAIFNSFSKLYEETTEYPITGAAISDDGTYVIVTQTQEYRSAIYVYDDGFRYVGRMLSNKLIMDIDIKKDGSEILIASAYNEEGDFYTEIMTWNPRVADEIKKFQVNDLMPVSAGYNSNGGCNIICDNRILFCDNNFELAGTYMYKNKVPERGFSGYEYACLVFPKNLIGDNYELIVFDNFGNTIGGADIKGKIIKTVPYENYLFVLTSDTVYKYDISSGVHYSSEVEKNALDLIIINDEAIILCYQGRALVLGMDSGFESLSENTVE